MPVNLSARPPVTNRGTLRLGFGECYFGHEEEGGYRNGNPRNMINVIFMNCLDNAGLYAWMRGAGFFMVRRGL
jgi:hypothetical protein